MCVRGNFYVIVMFYIMKIKVFILCLALDEKIHTSVISLMNKKFQQQLVIVVTRKQNPSTSRY